LNSNFELQLTNPADPNPFHNQERGILSKVLPPVHVRFFPRKPHRWKMANPAIV